jgi:uncharacterized protein (DUF4415 family)
MKKRPASSARAAQAGKNSMRISRRKIDFSDLPELSDRQLRTMRRVGRPPLGEEARQLIAIRVDVEVLRQLRDEAERRHVGYQTLVNDVLADYVKRIA